MALLSVIHVPFESSYAGTLPKGNFFVNSSVLLVVPNMKLGSSFTLAPEYLAAMRALYAL